MKILVVAPMKREKDNFKEALKKEPHKNEYKVINTGIGKAAAASEVAVHLASDQYDAIAVIGYAAAVGSFEVGDVVPAGYAWYGDIKGPHDLLSELYRHYELAIPSETPIITQDSFVDDMGVYELRQKFSDLEEFIIDMECTAVAQVAEDSEIPVLCVKMISDKPEQDDHEDFEKFVNEHSDFTEIVREIELFIQMANDNEADRDNSGDPGDESEEA